MSSPAAAPAAASTKLTRDQQQRRWLAFRSQPGNSTCCECASQDTTWAVLDYGILICINCAGAHRALGSHISKVRSTELDDFDESLFLWFESLGNKKNNERWEAELPATMRRPLERGPDCIRRWWLRAKYDEMRFLAGSESGGSSQETRRGWLQKQGAFLTSVWRSRFFVLDAAQLLYYLDEECDPAKLRGTMSLVGATVSTDHDDYLRLNLTLRAGGKVSEVATRAVSQADLEHWAWCLFHAIHAATCADEAAPAHQKQLLAVKKPSKRRSLFATHAFFTRVEPGDPRFARKPAPDPP